MTDTTDTLLVDLATYVKDLEQQRKSGNETAKRGTTIKIFVAIRKLREIGESGIENCIALALEDACLDFDHTDDYRNICWQCYRERGMRKALLAVADRRCPQCLWLICSECGSCRAPEFGGCSVSKAQHLTSQ